LLSKLEAFELGTHSPAEAGTPCLDWYGVPLSGGRGCGNSMLSSKWEAFELGTRSPAEAGTPCLDWYGVPLSGGRGCGNSMLLSRLEAFELGTRPPAEAGTPCLGSRAKSLSNAWRYTLVIFATYSGDFKRPSIFNEATPDRS